ncbi:ImuA family protein [Arcticibacter sp. MXS-1]|uniref:ImuA family protein n=1 Tax=Arcticibacter sp. MXS-1 TaxID=3341726 RepID=UPI0035A9709B
MMEKAKAAIINRLQKDILRWQGFNPATADNHRRIGLGPIEQAFPNGIFPTGTIHEMLCPTAEGSAATCGFLAGLLTSLSAKEGVCLWISTRRKLFPPSLNAFNAEADRLIFIDLARERDVLWAAEEALKCEGLAAVIAEVDAITFAQSRRLQLAVESSKVTGFILRNNLKKLSSTICVARWQITP